MPRLEDLPPDLRATLSLLVDRGKSYAQVAELLGIPEQSVRDRAHAALDALAGAPDESPTPYVAPPSSPPRDSARAGGQSARRAAASVSGAAAGLPVSRRGGALLLAGIVVVVVIVVVVLLSGGGGGGGSGSSTGTNASTSTSTNGHTTSSSTKSSASSSTTGAKGSTTGAKAKVTNQIALTPPESSSKSIGIAEVLAEGSQHAVYVAAEHLPPTHGFVYVLWLYDSPSNAQAIGKTTVNSTGRMQAGALLPSSAGNYHQLLLTRESAEAPSQPTHTVLAGAFALTK